MVLFGLLFSITTAIRSIIISDINRLYKQKKWSINTIIIGTGKNALKIAAHMRLGKVIEVNLSISLEAAKFGKQLKLPMADALICATARQYDCTIWTQDEHFKGLDGVRYFPKK